jgi:hypothetical protein
LQQHESVAETSADESVEVVIRLTASVSSEAATWEGSLCCSLGVVAFRSCRPCPSINIINFARAKAWSVACRSFQEIGMESDREMPCSLR